ncbi:MAG: hypothetical protein GF383_16815 [Candidatus Lokiarchaeota archaeon]|nr:hypothetical protein [Candidatus Lokiarchaeota archaeon]
MVMYYIEHPNYSSDETELDRASYYGDKKKVKELIKRGAPVSEWALYHASYYGYTDIVRMLIDYGAPVDENALYWASMNGYIEILQMLIDYHTFTIKEIKNIMKICNNEIKHILHRHLSMRMMEVL